MYDLVINNGLIVDGSENKPFVGSIGINGDKISCIAHNELNGQRIINASGLIVAPGFIDVHTHSDASFIVNNNLESKVFQGVTTEIIGNCGASIMPAPKLDKDYEIFKKYHSSVIIGINEPKEKIETIVDYKKMFLNKENTINCGVLAGHGSLRICAMGFDNREPTIDEMSYMKEVLDFELSNGAIGMSLGLIYPPGNFSKTNELVELGKVLKDHDAILTAHIRNENEQIFDAVKEIIEIAEISGVRVHISHLKLMGKSNWGKSNELIELIENANKKGVVLTFDQYPYNASSTTLTALLPVWLHEGGTFRMIERLNEYADEVEPQIEDIINERGGSKRIEIANMHGKMQEYEGMTLHEISEKFKLSSAKTAIKLINDTKGEIDAIYFSMSEEDVRNILSQPYGVVGSDGVGLDYLVLNNKSNLHPRNFGTFPRFFRLSKEIGLDKEIAVRKVTKLPAQYFKLEGIGELIEGNYADITIFDWDKFEDCAIYGNPYQKPSGLHHVIVSGKLIVKDGIMTQNRGGRLL